VKIPRRTWRKTPPDLLFHHNCGGREKMIVPLPLNTAVS
jgi:hypothetical protein